MKYWPYLRVGTALVLAAALASCAGALTWMAYRHDPHGPAAAGRLELPGLTQRVEVIRDRWGIPHLFAQNESDLMRAMGYVQAQDRLFQMDMLRRVVEGHLSEIVGERPLETAFSWGGRTTVEQDLGMRILGFEHNASIIVELMPPDQLELFEAYAQGVNAYLSQNRDNLPVEFRLLDYEPEPWRVIDSVALSRMVGWQLRTNDGYELLRAASDIILGEGGANRLLPLSAPHGPFIIPNYRFSLKKPSLAIHPQPLKELEKDQLSTNTIFKLFSLATSNDPEASNNWVVNGSKAVRGQPILANDPHLPHLAPSFFHLIHLSGAGYDTIGAALPGVPFVILGHNRHLAWAVTNCQADVADFYLHNVDPQHPERYLWGDTWEDFVVREEVVQVKEGSSQRPERIMVRVSRFGPVVTDLINKQQSRDVLALRWTGQDFLSHPDAYWELEKAATPEERVEVGRRYRKDNRGNDSIALREINLGQSCDDLFRALARYGNPRQNWICGDDGGNIGYVAAGLVPVRETGDGSRIARAWKNEGRWLGFIPFNELPQERNPQRGYIVTANNQTLDATKYPYPWASHYAPGYRAMRIEQMLNERAKLDAADMARMQGDRRSLLADDLVPLFIEAARQDEALTDARLMLERWNRVAEPDSAGAAVFYTAYDLLVRMVVEDETGPDLFNAMTRYHYTWEPLLEIVKDKKSPFHNSVRSKGKESWDISYRRALSAAYAQLQITLGPDPGVWTWGKLHAVTCKHMLGGQKGLAEAVNVGPYSNGGGPDTVWQEFFYPGSGSYATRGGPVFRHVVDMAAPAKSWLVLDTGNWGQPLTRHYSDLHRDYWRHSELAPGYLDREDIEAAVEGVLMLEPVALP